MIIYIDKDYHCHTTNPNGNFREFKSDFFDGKCVDFVEGYRFVPDGEEWTRSDGKVFTGPMISPWKEYGELDIAQRKYEAEKYKDAENALSILLGGGV